MSVCIGSIQANRDNLFHRKQALRNTVPFEFFNKFNFQEFSVSVSQFHQKVIKKLDLCETSLDKWIPPLEFQNSYDQMMKEVFETYNSPDADWSKFNRWLEDNGKSHWFSQLATFLAKLPLKAARNILQQIANLVKFAVMTVGDIVVHPIKSLVKFAKLLVNLVYTLIQPETWMRLGMGLLGTSLATLTFTSSPIAVISVAIGAALSITGISLGALKTYLNAQMDERFLVLKDYAISQAKTAAEDFMTAYCLGVIFQTIQRILRNCQEMYYKELNKKAIKEVNKQNEILIKNSKINFTEDQKAEFLKKYSLPEEEFYKKGDLSFDIRWRMDRVKYGELQLKELSEGILVIENIQTGTIYSYTDVWIEGYYKTTQEIASKITDLTTNTTTILYEPVTTYVNGYWDVATTRTPIYEQFFGYKVSVKGWVEPPLLPLPAPIPVPAEPLLTLNASKVIAAHTIYDSCKKSA